jgi:transcriptional regulator with XRE-family HTH domain
MSSINERIKLLREIMGLTQAELGYDLRVSRATINQWENASRQIKAKDIVKIADYFNVSADYLLGREESSIRRQFSDAEVDYIMEVAIINNNVHEAMRSAFRDATNMILKESRERVEEQNA